MWSRPPQVFSWDEAAGTYDENYEDGRSYISVISEVITDPDQDCDGRAKKDMGEARMDIVNSEIGYLGHYDSESYGLPWKVRAYVWAAVLEDTSWASHVTDISVVRSCPIQYSDFSEENLTRCFVYRGQYIQ